MLEKILEKYDELVDYLEDFVRKHKSTFEDSQFEEHKNGEQEEIRVRGPIWNCKAESIYPLINFFPKSEKLVRMQAVVQGVERPSDAGFYTFRFKFEALGESLKNSALSNLTAKHKNALGHGLHGMSSLFSTMRRHHCITLALHISYPKNFPSPSKFKKFGPPKNPEHHKQFKEIIDILGEKHLGIESEATRAKNVKEEKEVVEENSSNQEPLNLLNQPDPLMNQNAITKLREQDHRIPEIT